MYVILKYVNQCNNFNQFISICLQYIVIISIITSGAIKTNKAISKLSWKENRLFMFEITHNYHKEDFSVQGVVWLERNTKHL